MNDIGAEVLEPSLIQRATFRALFFYGGDLYSMPQQSGSAKALENAEAYAESVKERLTRELTS